MKRILAALILAPAISGAQNLVTNPTMTEMTSAAFRYGIEKAAGWSNSNRGTADLFVNSERSAQDGIPDNYMGSQEGGPYNYAGIVAYYGDECMNWNGEPTEAIGYGRYTEYVQGELSAPLKAGELYHFSFLVSLADKSDRAIRGLGAHFSAEKTQTNSNSFLQVAPQIVSKELITDMNGWTQISGTFVAHGGERYFTIGAFPEHLNVEKVAGADKNDSRKAYYYVARPSLIWQENENTPVTRTLSSGTEDEKKEAGTVYLDIHFATGSTAFRPGDTERLNAIVRFLAENPDIKIKIDGHADAVGSAAANLDLSARRAEVVKDYLVRHGVSSVRIKTTGYGEHLPIEHTSFESLKNRRIELYRVE